MNSLSPTTGPHPAPALLEGVAAQGRRFRLELKPGCDAGLRVVSGGWEHLKPGTAIHRTVVPFFGLEYIVRGRAEVKLNRDVWQLPPGGVFCYSPGMLHEIGATGSELLVRYYVEFTGSGAPGLLRSCKLTPGRPAKVFPPDALQGIFDELVSSGRRHDARSAALCGELLKCLALKLGGRRPRPDGEGTLAFATYLQCRRHIEQDFVRLSTLEQISQECHVTCGHVCRLFRRYDGQSPYQYLLRLKMRAAAAQLGQPGALVKAAAERVGFRDPFHFSRTFKNVLGLSPVAFRQLRGRR